MTTDNLIHSASLHVNTNSVGAFSFASVLNALRCWWKLATPFAILFAIAGGWAIYYLHVPQYTAFCELLIKEKTTVLKPTPIDTKKFINNQVEIMRSQRLLSQLLSRPELMSTPELIKEDDKVAALARRIKVTPKGQSDFYTLSFASRSAEKAKLVVTATSEAYLEFYRKRESEQEDHILQLLEQQRIERHKEMTELHDDLRAMTLSRTGVDPYRVESKVEKTTAATNPFSGFEAEIARTQVEQDVLAARIKAAETALKERVLDISPIELANRVEAHLEIEAIRAGIDLLRDKESKFRDKGTNLSANPAFKQLQGDIDGRMKDLEARRKAIGEEITDALKRQFRAAQSERIERMKEEWSEGDIKLKALRDTLKKELGDVKDTAKQYAGVNFELESLQNRYNEVSGIYKEICSRILAISTEQRAPERVELFKPASLPLSPDEIIPWKKMTMGAGIAFIMPFALAIGWEQLIRRVTSRGQLESVNRLSVVGEITALPSRRRGSSQKKQTERSVMLFEESVDCLRTYLSLGNNSSQELRVLTVTSAVSQEGKTTLAAQLAVSIARATGEMTLLIDGDMRSPGIHEVFDIELGPGLAEVLCGDCPAEESIETGFNEKLHILTAGRLSASPHQLLGNNNFNDLVDRLCTTYRYVVIDTPPILPASEALVLARVADTCVLCVRQDFSRMDQVNEAYRRMTAAGINTAGAVLNGIPFQEYAHKYGSYAYNRPLAS